MAFTNLGEAKKIIEKIPTGYFGDKKGLLNGKGTTLSLGFNDIRSFAYKESGNILDKINEIGRLYAESLLTRTTSHKFNDFKTVYRESQSYWAVSRNDFRELFERAEFAGSGEDTKEKAKNIKEKLKAFEKGLENKSTSDAIEEFANILGVKDSDKKAFASRMNKHAEKINQNLKKMKSMLKNKNFSMILEDRLKNASDSELMGAATQVVRESGINLSPKQLVDHAKEISDMRDDLAGSLQFGLGIVPLIVGIIVSFGVGLPLVLTGAAAGLCGILITGLSAILGAGSLHGGLLLGDRLPMPLIIRRFKRMLNNLNKCISKIFEEIADFKVYIMSLKPNRDLNSSGNYLSTKTIDNVNKRAVQFVEQVRSIWAKYATAEGKFYTNFSDMLSDSSANLGKIKKLSDKISNLETERKSCNKQIELLEEKISKQDRKLTELEEAKNGYTRNAQISGRESNGGKKDTIMEMLLANLEKEENAKSALEKNKAEAEGELNKLKEQIEERNKQIEELNQQMDVSKMRRPTEKERHWSGLLYKSNKSDSPLGKAKQSYARTLCNDFKYTPWSRVNKPLNLSLD